MRSVQLLSISAVFLILGVGLAPIDGTIGHDYYHQFTRFFIGAIYFWQNGWSSIPHYTPALGAGLPYFADPQCTYYSLPQWLTFYLDPYVSSFITIILFYIIGYTGSYRLLRKSFTLSQTASFLGSLFFLVNGFSFAHLLVGHLTHHTFLLIPWLLHFYLNAGKGDSFRNALFFSLLTLYIFYSGGMHILIVLSATIILFTPYALASSARKAHMVRFMLLASLFVLLGCSGKLLASYHYSKNFVQYPVHTSETSYWIQWLRYFWFIPSNTPATESFERWVFGAWEYVGFISKLSVVSLAYLAYLIYRGKVTIQWTPLFMTLVFALLLSLISLAHPITSSFPLLRLYHNPIKLLSALIPLFSVLFAISTQWLHQSLRGHTANGTTLLIALFLVIEFAIYTHYFTSARLGVSFKYNATHYQELKSRSQLPTVLSVTNKSKSELHGILNGETSIRSTEPLFGYLGERLRSHAKVGRSTQKEGGYFNLNHPGCLVYPTYFHCVPWERIPTDHSRQFEQFITGFPAFAVPPWQQFLLKLNFASLLILITWTLCLLCRSQLRWVCNSVTPRPLQSGT